ncbi:uncharacterized protein LOC130949747 [Arachis stenosperma]|uniref:uncharacterized protein LOC130949747 n=1 Tax=Arachis stenosperma TaxID=217475 RepID=UPI0025ACC1B4|nr:uncharacterized protein LOC130949747 [Arachis stenosperma]
MSLTKLFEVVHPQRALIESPMLSEKETLKEGETVVFTKEAEPQEFAIEGLKAITDQKDPETAIKHSLAEVREPQELPFHGVQKELADEQLAHFPATLKELQVKISFTEVLGKRIPYMAYLKDTLFEKKDLREDEIEILTEKYSVLIQHELPIKMPDPGSFQILWTTEKIIFDKALYDLGLILNRIPSIEAEAKSREAGKCMSSDEHSSDEDEDTREE